MRGADPDGPVFWSSLKENGELVAVRFTSHARERFRDRVRPGIDERRATLELQGLSAAGTLQREPPTWLDATQQAPAMYLVAGDIAFPVDPSRGDQQRLTAITCLTRPTRSRTKDHRPRQP